MRTDRRAEHTRAAQPLTTAPVLCPPPMTALPALRTTLQHTPPADGAMTGEPLRAAVCAVVAGPERAPSLCLIRRARWQGDPWSEHIALPGGRRNGDEAAPATARRELREEVGLDLPEADLV